MIKLIFLVITSFIGFKSIGEIIFDKTIEITLLGLQGILSKLLFILPLFIVLYFGFYLKKSNDKEKDILKKTGLYSILTLVDLFYSSLTIYQDKIAGIILSNKWLTINKTVSSKEIALQILDEIPDLNIRVKLAQIIIPDNYTKEQIINTYLNYLNKKEPSLIDNLFNIILNNFHSILICLTLITIILSIIYWFKSDDINNYVIDLGQKMIKLIQKFIEQGKINYLLLENDKNMAFMLQNTIAQQELTSKQVAILIKEGDLMLLRIEKIFEKLNLLEEDTTIIENKLNETKVIIEKIITHFTS